MHAVSAPLSNALIQQASTCKRKHISTSLDAQIQLTMQAQAHSMLPCLPLQLTARQHLRAPAPLPSVQLTLLPVDQCSAIQRVELTAHSSDLAQAGWCAKGGEGGWTRWSPGCKLDRTTVISKHGTASCLCWTSFLSYFPASGRSTLTRFHPHP